MSHGYSIARARIARTHAVQATEQNAQARALLAQIALHLGVRSKHPADLLAAAEKLSLSMMTMCKDWESLAEQIRTMQAELAEARQQLAEVTKERDQLQLLLQAADALRNHDRGIVTSGDDVVVVPVERRKVPRGKA